MLTLGISPRSYQHILALARVTAFLHGRTYVRPGDVQEILCDAIRHRLVRSVRAEAENVRADAIVEEILRGGADPVMMAGLHCTGRRARSGVVRS